MLVNDFFSGILSNDGRTAFVNRIRNSFRFKRVKSVLGIHEER